MLEISEHSRCKVVSMANSPFSMTCLDAPFNIKKLLDPEIFEIECIGFTFVLEANFGSQTHVLI